MLNEKKKSKSKKPVEFHRIFVFFELVKYKVVKKQLKDKPFKIAKKPGH